MKIKIQFFLILITSSLTLKAQVKDSIQSAVRIKQRSLSLLAGIALGKYSFADIGFSVNTVTSVGPHPFSFAYFISNEIKLDNKIIIGPKIGAWVAGGSGAIAVGVNMIYYTDFTNGSLIFRPEIGVSIDNFKIVYGYNANLTNKSFNRINTNLVAFTYCFKLRLKEILVNR